MRCYETLGEKYEEYEIKHLPNTYCDLQVAMRKSQLFRLISCAENHQEQFSPSKPTHVHQLVKYCGNYNESASHVCTGTPQSLMT